MAIWTDIVKADWLVALARDLNHVLDERDTRFLRAITAYHSIPKDIIFEFRRRAELLRQVFLACPPSQPSGQLFLKLELLTAAQAHMKREYLLRIADFCHLHRSVLDAALVANIMKRPHADPYQALLSSGPWQYKPSPGRSGVSLVGTTAMEAIDPYHRPFEIAYIKGKTAESFKAPNFEGNLHNVVLAEWATRVVNSGEKRPFFAYLETSAICNPNEQARLPASPYDVAGHVVAYGGQASIVSIDRGQAFEYVVGEPALTGRLFDTTDREGIAESSKGDAALAAFRMVKSELDSKARAASAPGPATTTTTTTTTTMALRAPGAFAYVWREGDGGRHFFVGLHRNDASIRVHHSSLASGMQVLCAGMIGAINGKIVYISNDSGHYKPSADDLKRVCAYLSNRDAIHPSAIVSDVTQKPMSKRHRLFSEYKSAESLWIDANPNGRRGDITIGARRRPLPGGVIIGARR